MNEFIFFFFYNFAHQSALLDQIVVFFAVYFPYAVIIFAGLFLLMHHEVLKAETPWQTLMEKKREVLITFSAGVSAWILAVVFKFLFHTDRPFDVLAQVIPLFHPFDYAFPSGHATFFMALAFSIYFLHKKAGYWFIVFAVLIGLARIAAGVHFPIDILGGFTLGVLAAYIVEKKWA